MELIEGQRLEVKKIDIKTNKCVKKEVFKLADIKANNQFLLMESEDPKTAFPPLFVKRDQSKLPSVKVKGLTYQNLSTLFRYKVNLLKP